MGELYVDPLELPVAGRIKKEQRRIVCGGNAREENDKSEKTGAGENRQLYLINPPDGSHTDAPSVDAERFTQDEYGGVQRQFPVDTRGVPVEQLPENME